MYYFYHNIERYEIKIYHLQNEEKQKYNDLWFVGFVKNNIENIPIKVLLAWT